MRLICMGKKRVINTDFAAHDKFDLLPKQQDNIGPSAFLSIQEGCDKFCAFCVVPYTRGAEYSRPIAQVLAEAEQLLSGGAKELIVLGQNVNAYHGAAPNGGTWNMGQLLYALAALKGLERIRYMTSHPRDMHEELYTAHRDLPQVIAVVTPTGAKRVGQNIKHHEPQTHAR